MLPDWTSSHVGIAPVGKRNPAHTGKMIATVDNIAGGRIIPGFGSGWMAREFSDFGMPFVSTRDRLRQLEEGLQIFRGMFDPDQDEFSFEGEYFHTENLVTQPKPPRDMPILVGGGGEQVTMRIAAQYADIWNNSAGAQDNLEHKVSVLHGHAERLGRDPSEIRVSQQCLVTIVEDDEKVGPMVERAQKIFGGHMGNPAGDMALTGTPGHDQRANQPPRRTRLRHVHDRILPPRHHRAGPDVRGDGHPRVPLEVPIPAPRRDPPFPSSPAPWGEMPKAEGGSLFAAAH